MSDIVALFCEECQTPRACLKCKQADEITRLRAQVAGLEEVLINTRQALERANTTPNGPICDTIWYSNHETLFDYIDAALAARKGAA